MPKLNDLQRVLLSAAAQRDDHSLLPLPETVSAGTRVTKAISALIDTAFAQEREVIDRSLAHRTDGDLHYGVFATDIGLAAIGVGEAVADIAQSAVAPPVAPITKTATIIALLQREGGATLAELIAATGWLPHTTRAALTGVRKKGHAVERFSRDGATCYRVAVTA